jgi:2-keto-myo-inositol isomerase
LGSGWHIGLNGANTMACGIAEEIEIAARTGYDCVELRDWKVAEFLKKDSPEILRELLRNNGLRPIALNTIEPAYVASSEDLRRLQKDAEWRLSAARAVGCPYVVASFYGAPKDVPEAAARRRVIEGLGVVCDVARDYGVEVLYEFLGSRLSPFHTVSETMELLGLMDCENLGWLLDFYHFHVADGYLGGLLEADVTRLHLVHIDDARDLPYEALEIPNSERVFPGDGVIDSAGILRALHAIGYRGPFSVELFNTEYLSWDPVDFARTAREKTVAMLKEHFR